MSTCAHESFMSMLMILKMLSSKFLLFRLLGTPDVVLLTWQLDLESFKSSKNLLIFGHENKRNAKTHAFTFSLFGECVQ